MFKDFKPLDFRSTSYFKAILTTILLYIIHLVCLGTFVYFSGNNYLSYVLANTFLIVVIFLLERKRLTEAIKNIKKDGKGKILNIFIVTVSLLLLEFIVNFILIKIIGKVPDNTTNIIASINDNKAYMIPYFINTIVLLPIVESLIYFYPFNNIKKSVTKFIVYTVMFALFHMIASSSLLDLLFVIPYLILSFAITYGYYKTDNIIYPMFAHMFNNILAAINLLIILR